MKDRISREDIVRLYNIEITFFDDLESSGLIETEVIDNTTYLHYDQLSAFERFTNWHYDLEVNMAGLEIIHRLLQQIEELKGVRLEVKDKR
ncbi:chaperone modulator CbpM [Capnocytophaga ochracea]|uniref:chaperone modulator CbpM n=1 Tax=Capnocytophaga ochracea TaxID=1018 RepID=UPI00241F5883|nr:chaperone modulator CbpM [Capnocytophaga ochracea]